MTLDEIRSALNPVPRASYPYARDWLVVWNELLERAEALYSAMEWARVPLFGADLAAGSDPAPLREQYNACDAALTMPLADELYFPLWERMRSGINSTCSQITALQEATGKQTVDFLSSIPTSSADVSANFHDAYDPTIAAAGKKWDEGLDKLKDIGQYAVVALVALAIIMIVK